MVEVTYLNNIVFCSFPNQLQTIEVSLTNDSTLLCYQSLHKLKLQLFDLLWICHTTNLQQIKQVEFEL